MGFVNNVLDWASDKVQSFTGEKERREYVDEIKTTYDGFKEQITENASVRSPSPARSAVASPKSL